MPRALSGRPEAEIGSGLAPALCVRCYRRKRAQGGAMGRNDKSLTGEVIPDRIAVVKAFLQAADPYLRFSRVSGRVVCGLQSLFLSLPSKPLWLRRVIDVPL